jgi:hypothetical protein
MCVLLGGACLVHTHYSASRCTLYCTAQSIHYTLQGGLDSFHQPEFVPSFHQDILRMINRVITKHRILSDNCAKQRCVPSRTPSLIDLLDCIPYHTIPFTHPTENERHSALRAVFRRCDALTASFSSTAMRTAVWPEDLTPSPPFA